MPDPVALTRQTYDKVAAEYARKWAAPGPALAAHVDELCRSLPPGAHIADIGCGPGRDTALLRQRGLRVLGFDLSMGMLRAGHLDGVAQADMRRLPLADNSLDGIWCNAAMMHVPRPEVPQVLAEFGRVLRPSAPLHLRVTEGDGQTLEATQYRAGGHRLYVHHRLDDLVNALARTGFTIETSAHRATHRQWLDLRARRTPR